MIRLQLVNLLFIFSASAQCREITFSSQNDIDTVFFKTDHTFDGNRAHFNPDNVYFDFDNKAIDLNVQVQQRGDRLYTGAEIKLKPSISQNSHYGHYEVNMQPACISGSVTGFFLFRWDPWQEIDIEFIGDHKNEIQTSIVNNFAPRGTPANNPEYQPRIFKLPFDPCDGLHNYVIDWGLDKIQFFADGLLIDERVSKQFQLPNFSADLIINVWLNGDPNWTGLIHDWELPAKAKVQKIIIRPNRTEQIISEMSLEEKIWYLGGTGMATHAMPKFKVPAIDMTDGPVGLRFGQGTAFPSGISVGASFNPQLAGELGKSIGIEARSSGAKMLLGPAVDILRTPWAGRAFEAYGEDPLLAAHLAEKYIAGLQSENVMACVKHFIMNNQEINRDYVDVKINEQALREIYLPPFVSAIKAGVACVMASYNKIDGKYASEQSELIALLKNELHFKGMLISDWGATHSTLAAANAGLDLEMPVGKYFGPTLYRAVRGGEVSLDIIDDKVRRILGQIERFGFLENSDLKPQEQLEKHTVLAQKIAEESFVLLKNDTNLLPLSVNKQSKLAIIGPNAFNLRSGGGGSSYVFTDQLISPKDAINNYILKNKLNVLTQSEPGIWHLGDRPNSPLPYVRAWVAEKFEQGLVRESFPNADLQGIPTHVILDQKLQHDWDWASPDSASLPEDAFSMRFHGEFVAPSSGEYELQFLTDDGLRLRWNHQLVIDDWDRSTLESPLHANSYKVILAKGEIIPIEIEYFERDTLATFYFGVIPPSEDKSEQKLVKAQAIAANSDVAVVFVGFDHKTESEGFDRIMLSLPEGQDELIQKVADQNPNTIVIINSGGPITMPWLSSVKSVLQVWYPGEAGGAAIARALFGEISPSGKLPMTFPSVEADGPAFRDYPEVNGELNYHEGVFVGYRYFDKNNITPLFPFGFGLSYSKFEIQPGPEAYDLQMHNEKIQFSIQVKNIGSYRASEVVQVYIEPPSHPLRPTKALKAFQKVDLLPGESKVIQFELNKDDFKWFDIQGHNWRLDPGTYKINVGSSSRDFAVRYSLQL